MKADSITNVTILDFIRCYTKKGFYLRDRNRYCRDSPTLVLKFTFFVEPRSSIFYCWKLVLNFKNWLGTEHILINKTTKGKNMRIVDKFRFGSRTMVNRFSIQPYLRHYFQPSFVYLLFRRLNGWLSQVKVWLCTLISPKSMKTSGFILMNDRKIISNRNVNANMIGILYQFLAVGHYISSCCVHMSCPIFPLVKHSLLGAGRRVKLLVSHESRIILKKNIFSVHTLRSRHYRWTQKCSRKKPAKAQLTKLLQYGNLSR